ncbi:MAG: hypothetical protein WDM90_12930 [Ferruginibacter sp.]
MKLQFRRIVQVYLLVCNTIAGGWFTKILIEALPLQPFASVTDTA